MEVTELNIFLFKDSIQPLNFLRQNGDSVLILGHMLLANFVQFLLQLFVIVANDFELILKFAHSASWQTEVFLSWPHFLSESRVLSDQFLKPLFVSLGFLVALPESSSEFVELVCQLGSLLSWQSHCLLSLLHLSAKSPDLSISLFDQSVESFALLSQNVDLVLRLSRNFFQVAFEFSDSSLHFLVLSLHVFELSSQAADLSGRKSEVFLSVSDFIAERVVLGQKLLNSLFVGFGFLRKSAVFVSEVSEFAVESVSLLSWQSHCLLSLLHLSAKSSDFSISLFDQSVESFAFLSQNVNFVLELCFHAFPSIFGVAQFLFGGVKFAAHSLELALKLVQSSRRESEVLLSVSHFVAKSSVLSHKFLNLLFVSVDFLSRLTELISVVVEFGT